MQIWIRIEVACLVIERSGLLITGGNDSSVQRYSKCKKHGRLKMLGFVLAERQYSHQLPVCHRQSKI